MTRGEMKTRKKKGKVPVENPFSDGENGVAERGKQNWVKNFRKWKENQNQAKRFKNF